MLDTFGKNIVLVRGWDFSPRDFYDSWDNSRLLTVQIETSNICDLLCEYCFRMDMGMNSKKRLPGEISVDDTFSMLGLLARLGTRTINIIGAGEPVLDPSLLEIANYISEKGMTPVVFTNGARLDEHLVRGLYDVGSSVIIKLNSFDHVVQDRLANRAGYTQKRDSGLRLLLEAGFNKSGGGYTTRLGIDSIVCRDNINEMPSIHRYCRENNIMPLIKTFIPAGRTKERTDMEVSRQEFIELSKQIQEIDARDYNIFYNQLIPYSCGVPCTQCSKSSMYITIIGDIYECPGMMRNYGNIRNVSITDAFSNIRPEQGKNFSCPPRIIYWKNNS